MAYRNVCQGELCFCRDAEIKGEGRGDAFKMLGENSHLEYNGVDDMLDNLSFEEEEQSVEHDDIQMETPPLPNGLHPVKQQPCDQTLRQQLNGTIQQEQVGINLKGINQVLQIKSRKQQLQFIMALIQGNGCHVVTVKASPPQSTNIKIVDQQKLQKVEANSQGIKIETVRVEDKENSMKMEEGSEGLVPSVSQPALIYIQSEQMFKNFNSYGQCLYYHQILHQGSENRQISVLCGHHLLKIGLVYGFSLQMKPVTFGVYSVYGYTQQFETYQASYLMNAILQTANRKGSANHPYITLYVHALRDIAMLEGLARPYRQRILSSRPNSKASSFAFMVDPSLLNPNELFKGQQFPRKQQMELYLSKLLTTPSRRQFGLLQTKLYLMLTENNLSSFKMKMNNEQTVSLAEYVETIMQQAEYICESQTDCLLGISQYYFKEHGGRQKILSQIRQAAQSQWLQLYHQLEEQQGTLVMTQNVLFFLALGLIDKLVRDEGSEGVKVARGNYQQLNRYNYKLIEEDFPELKFLKLQTSKYIYQYLVRELTEGIHWQVDNQFIVKGVKYFNLQLQQQDQLYFQQYHPLPIRVQKIQSQGGHRDYYWVTASEDRKDRWQCQCAHSKRYGLPCRHQLKVCGLTKYPIRNHICPGYWNEEYYDECVEEGAKLQAKREQMKMKISFLEPMGTQPGRNALLNKKVNKRRFGGSQFK